MNKTEFLKKLKKALVPLPDDDRNELITDYEAHFSFGIKEGKSEDDIILMITYQQRVWKEGNSLPSPVCVCDH